MLQLFFFVFLITMNMAAVSDGTKRPPKKSVITKQKVERRGIPEGKRLNYQTKKPRGIVRRGSVVFVPAGVIKEETSKIQTLTSSFKFRPYRDMRGKPSGYQLHSLVQGGFAALLGFREKDVILSVNKRQLKSASDIYKTFRRIKKSRKKSAAIEFMRDGKKQVLKIIRREEKHD